jgi:hypothetical protein
MNAPVSSNGHESGLDGAIGVPSILALDPAVSHSRAFNVRSDTVRWRLICDHVEHYVAAGLHVVMKATECLKKSRRRDKVVQRIEVACDEIDRGRECEGSKVLKKESRLAVAIPCQRDAEHFGRSVYTENGWQAKIAEIADEHSRTACNISSGPEGDAVVGSDLIERLTQPAEEGPAEQRIIDCGQHAIRREVGCDRTGIPDHRKFLAQAMRVDAGSTG